MLKLILGAVGHGKMQYGLLQTVEKSHGKKVLIISNEIPTEIILKRLSKIYEFYPTISPIEVLVKSEFDYSNLSFATNYDIISVLSYVHNTAHTTHQAAKEVFISCLKKIHADFPEKEIMATIQMHKAKDVSLNSVKEIFFETKLETDEAFNQILVYRDSETENFKILNHHKKEVETINKRDFFCEL